MSSAKEFSRRVISAMLCLAQVATPIGLAHAQVPTGPVSLANVPVNAVVTVKPNVMFTLDNSGSMNWAYAPMWVDDTQFDGKYCQTASSFNNLYYQPNQNYLAPVLADGSRMPNASYNNAPEDGFNPGSVRYDLASKYSDPGGSKGGSNPKGYDLNGGHNQSNRGGYYMVYNGVGAPDPTVCYPDTSYTIVNVNTQTAAQQLNFANWFSYYRTRISAIKSAVGEAFRTINDDFRVGFHTINNPGGGGNTGTFIPVDTFTGAQRINWYNAFYLQQANGGTPLRHAQVRIGEYFHSRTSPATNAQLPVAQDPITSSCQQNYHLLSTDGQWNDGIVSGAVGSGNWDATIPNSPLLLDALNKEFAATFSAGDPWPRPYREGTPVVGSLADLATYYWMTDMRPTLPDNVPTSAGDSASWQHMTTFGIAFSEQGSIPYPSGLGSIVSGASDWPTPAADAPSAVDDLWHASLNGHGRYFNVRSPAELMNALSAALNEIKARSGSASGVQFNSNNLTQSATNYAYRAGYTGGDWTGDVGAYSVDNSTGGLSSPNPVWSAKTKLDALVTPVGAGGGWDINRKIATRRSDTGAAVPFRWVNLAAAQQLTISPADPARGQRMVDYLRGDRSNEDAPGFTREFRRRVAVLGDIVNSEPVFIQAPNEPYVDVYNPGYSAFKAGRAGRRPMIYVGANDGMLHAIDASVGATTSGVEQWAYVPGLTYKPGVDGLAGLAFKNSDPLPDQFSHRFRVDQSPWIQDVNFAATNGGAGIDWRTLLVAGMNKGGKGYYALDVSNPEAANEGDVAGKALWEFTGDVANDPKMGYTFGKPQVFKTRRFGWVVAVTSGYNNAAGTGHVWLLNPTNGNIYHRFDSGVGSVAVPSGLGHVSYFTQDAKDHTAEQIYTTDLMGNVFRFDVSSANATDWITSGVKIASVGLPITAKATSVTNPFNPSERWVFFGTGRQLDVADRTSAAQQSLYAVKDGSATNPAVVVTALTKAALFNLPLGGQFTAGEPSIKGWYINLPIGQHVITHPVVIRGVVTFITTNPTEDVCSPGATSTQYSRIVGTGVNWLNGALYYTSNANIVKVQLLRLPPNGTPTSSKGRYASNHSRGDGTSGAGSPNEGSYDFQLNGGRTGLRFLRTQ